MDITSDKYYSEYYEAIGHKIDGLIASFEFHNTADLTYSTKTSAVYSSQIEGSRVDLNSYMNSKLSDSKFSLQKDIEEINDLVEAYKMAQSTPLNEENLLKAHSILSTSFLIKSSQGIYRTSPVGVFGKSGLTYLAVEPEYVAREMAKLMEDVKSLIDSEIIIEKVFYHASLLHLRFAHVHPFMDGNGRVARLIEKWFLAEKLGEKFWKLTSEKNYLDNRQEYYDSIDMGVNFYELEYSRCQHFLYMLPEALTSE